MNSINLKSPGMHSGVVSFTENLTPIVEKISKINQQKTANELNREQKIVADIGDALLEWRGNYAANLALLKIPQDMTFTDDEIDLAGWSTQYAKIARIPYKNAITAILEYLNKADPEQLKNYKKDITSFSESSMNSVSFAAPIGYTCYVESLKDLVMVRAYQVMTGSSFDQALKVIN